VSESAAFPVPANVAASGQVGPLTPTGYVTVSGVSVAETAGTATRVELRDGASATGNVVASFQLAAYASTPLGDLPNVRVPGGLYVKVVGAGTLIGSVYVR
jgi:hypothetical protein